MAARLVNVVDEELILARQIPYVIMPAGFPGCSIDPDYQSSTLLLSLTKAKAIDTMSELIYPRERTLGNITLILGLLAWLGLIVRTFGMALTGLAIGFVLYLFRQSTRSAHFKR